MRLLILALLLPAAAAAQPVLRFDIGIAQTGRAQPYGEVAASATARAAGPLVVGATVSRASAMYSVDYEPGWDGGFYAYPSTVREWTTLSAFSGVRFGTGVLAVQATAGPVLSIASLDGNDTLIGGGVAAEVGLVDVYPVRSVGLGLSVHGATTTSHSWAGVRLGVRARL